MKATGTLVLVVIGLLRAVPAQGQSITAELDLTAGGSTQDAAATAAQLRAFGEVKAGIQFYVEGAWAKRQDDHNSDVFGAAYPYGDRVQVIEAYGERLFRPGPGLFGIRAGRFRTPFGIHGRSDHAYSGFLRAPLMRYDNYFGLSNNFLEHGVDIMAGLPQLFAEVSLGTPADVGSVKRRDGLDRVVRVQGFRGPLIVGASRSRTLPYQPLSRAPGHAVFTGIDARWMHAGVQFRGEFLTGHPFEGAGIYTKGGYVDVIVHRRSMGPLTAVARVEKLIYDTPRVQFATSSRRFTAGGRVRLPGGLSAQLDLIRQTGTVATRTYRTALDVALTYSARLTPRAARNP